MVSNQREASEPRWKKSLRTGAVIIGLVGIAAGPILLYFVANSHVGWAAIIAGLIFMISSRLDEVVEIGFGSFKTKLERRVRDVEEAMDAVRYLAKASARNALNAVQYTGRMGGFTEQQKVHFLLDTRRLLRDLGISAEEAQELENDWHDAVEFDYASWATGGDQVPNDLPHDLMPAWKNLRKGGIANRASPEEIRSFFRDADLLTLERKEILLDYEHYLETREHRREKAWQDR